MRAERAASFARVADAYEQARPGYPADAVLWVVGETPCDVVDLGAGTGKLTRSLAALGHHVVAVEPLGEMLDLLRVAVPGATAVVGSAESMPLPDGAADVVACAQAFHWFDHGPALEEIARVLRPGGRVGVSDVVADDDLTPDERAERGSYVGCVAGALSFAEYRAGLAAVGLVDVDITPTHSVADGLHAAIVRATKPASSDVVGLDLPAMPDLPRPALPVVASGCGCGSAGCC